MGVLTKRSKIINMKIVRWCIRMRKVRTRVVLAWRSVVMTAKDVKMPWFRRCGVDPELCMAAGLSPLRT